MRPLEGSIAVIHDMPEEGWPSMDQMGHLLTSRLPVVAPRLTVTPVQHRMTRVFSPGPLGRVRPLFSADRVLNRMLLYPRKVKRTAGTRFDIYHIVDHSYAQLALALPEGRTIVTCHDIDTFRSLVEPDQDPRNPLFNLMPRRIFTDDEVRQFSSLLEDANRSGDAEEQAKLESLENPLLE